MNLYPTTPPTEEPITVAQAAAHLRLDTGQENELLARLIKSARQWAEAATGRAFCSQTWTLKMPAFPMCGFELPKPPAASVTSIKYLDNAGAEQTWSSSEYTVTGLAGDGRARIEPAYGYTWPANRIEQDAVRVLFIAGYGTAAEVPEGIKDALLAHVAEAFQNRERPDFEAAESALWPWMALRFDE